MNFESLPVVNERPRAGAGSNATVPSADAEVRAALRERGQAETLANETAAQRRVRLLQLIQGGAPESTSGSGSSESESDDEDFYTPGSEDVLAARKFILSSSLARAKDRLAWQRRTARQFELASALAWRRQVNAALAHTELYGSQTVGTARALAKVRYSGDDDPKVAVGSWDGSVHVLDGDLVVVARSAPHLEKASALDWSKDAKLVLSGGGGEGDICVWDYAADTRHTAPRAHLGYRVTDTVYDPTNRFFASTLFDQTWQLWDTTTMTALYQQEGHSKELYCGAFHPDGGLFVSGGLDALARVWDLRSGRSICVLEGHIGGIYAADWSPNGVHLATASGDGLAKIWDLRQQGSEVFLIPAHPKLVSLVRFYNSGTPDRTNGTHLVTASYDGTVKIWSADSWIKVATLEGHTDKVMSCDVRAGEVVSCGWDRTVKTWRQVEEAA